MAIFSNLVSTETTKSTDIYLTNQGGIGYKQTREALGAAISNTRWSSDFDYKEGSLIVGSDSNLYRAVQDNGASSTVQDPTGDTNETYWYKVGLVDYSSSALALGESSGGDSQGDNAIAVGFESGTTDQGSYSVAIGYQCGVESQPNYSLAIGYQVTPSTEGEINIATNEHSLVVDDDGLKVDGSQVASFTAIFEAMFPVGTVYTNYSNSANPNTYLTGGDNSTWVAISGRVVVGVGTGTDANSVSKTFAAQATGGEYTHTITTAQMPSHTHTYSGTSSSSGAHTHSYELSRAYDESSYAGNYIGYGQNETVKSPISGKIYSAGAHTHTYSGTTASRGNSNAMNVMQPYITCYVWRRTA